MRPILILIVAMIAGAAAPAADKKPGKSLQDQMQGEWLLVKAIDRGQEEKKDEGVKLVVKDSKMTIFEREVREGDDATFKLDESKKPVAIDITPKGPDAKEHVLGIIRIDGDRMTICFAKDAREARPTAFASPKDSKITLLEFQRAKK